MSRWVFAVLALTLGAEAVAEDAYVAAETPSLRFFDADIAGPTFASNTKVEVILRDGDRARVREGDSYGWIAAAALSAAPADPMSDPELMKRLQEQFGDMKLQLGDPPSP